MALALEQFLAILTLLFGALFAQTADIVWTNHSLTKHQKEKYNAEILVGEILSFFNNGGNCPPESKCEDWDFWVCLDRNGEWSPHGKFLCNIRNNKKWAGVIIGLKDKNPVIVTAYMATQKYWERQIKKDKCFAVGMTAKLLKRIIEMMMIVQ